MQVWRVVVVLIPIVLRVFKSPFSKNNKKLFPLFFLLFREQRKNGISPCFQFGVIRVVPVIFLLRHVCNLQHVSLPARYQGAIRSFFSIKSLSWTQIPGAYSIGVLHYKFFLDHLYNFQGK
ncbi:hypothetical protein VitviT2T_024364 [Vitis vinifera]|uniref:Secreted protein n=1 Tax=Vitis vinifera TaxID=29760 RepID=A0ABY9DHH1_VITVI